MDQPLLAAPWEWGRTVMTGAMAEHEELETTKAKLVTIDQQLEDLKNEFNQKMEELQIQTKQEIEEAAKQAYKQGVKQGSIIGIIVGLGIGIAVSN